METMRPLPTAPPIVWSIYLGCNTTGRLAREWGLNLRQAYFRLNYARRMGWAKKKYRCTRKGMHCRWSLNPKILEKEDEQ